MLLGGFIGMRPARDQSACIIFLCQRNNAQLRDEMLLSQDIKNSAQLRGMSSASASFVAAKKQSFLRFCRVARTTAVSLRLDYLCNGATTARPKRAVLISTLVLDAIVRLRECLRIAMSDLLSSSANLGFKYDAVRRAFSLHHRRSRSYSLRGGRR